MKELARSRNLLPAEYGKMLERTHYSKNKQAEGKLFKSKRKMGGHYSQEEKILLEADRVRMKHLNKKGI